MRSTDQRQETPPEQVTCTSEIKSVEQALTRLIRLAETRRTSGPVENPRNRLDRAAYALLTRLDECPTTRLTELAALMEIDLSTASRQVRSLQDRGFVARIDDPRDQRAARLELTEAGREVLAAAQARRVERIASRLANWEQRDVEELARLLPKFVASLTEKAGLSPVASPEPRTAQSSAQR